MQKFLTTLVIIILLISAVTVIAQECRSDSGGYCATLTPAPAPEEPGILSGLAQVPGLEFLGLGQDASLGQILSALYVFGLGLVGVSALLVLTGAGIRYMTAGDNESALKEAKSWMTNAVFGLVLALISWLILVTINPDLTRVVDIENLLQKIDVNPNAETPPNAETYPDGSVGPYEACFNNDDCANGLSCLARSDSGSVCDPS